MWKALPRALHLPRPLPVRPLPLWPLPLRSWQKQDLWSRARPLSVQHSAVINEIPRAAHPTGRQWSTGADGSVTHGPTQHACRIAVWAGRRARIADGTQFKSLIRVLDSVSTLARFSRRNM